MLEMKDRMVEYVQQLQDTICQSIESIDSTQFIEDNWQRPGGGGGRTRVIQGSVIEKGGVNTSIVYGEMPNSMQQKFNVEGANFFATGISLVLHPANPHAPTCHANWRYFEMYDSSGKLLDAWFGGGQDLTPYYLYEEDCIHWHTICKTACDKHKQGLYQEYKQWCDNYFFNSHRGEARGIGGLFFDYLRNGDNEMNHEQWFAFIQEIGNSFLTAYLPILNKRYKQPFTEQEKYWQQIRRGRYVEFNLIHDRGTLFGLKTNGRIESILMSLPPTVRWDYQFEPYSNKENELLEVLTSPKDWLLCTDQEY